MQSSPTATLDWISHEINFVSNAVRAGRMKLDVAFDSLDAIRKTIADDRSVTREAGEEQATEPAVALEYFDAGSGDGRSSVNGSRDFATEDNPSKRRPFRIFTADFQTGEVLESPHRLSKREAVDLFESWKTRKEQAALIFWPDYAGCPPFPHIHQEAVPVPSR